jgi:CheY-like chemotaxis protein/DNA-binding XRE family transcriptional regulator
MQSADDQKSFGFSVRFWRELRGFSQEKLGERADLHRTYISDVERGARNLSLQSIARLSRALEVSISTLFPPQLDEGVTSGSGHPELGTGIVDILYVEDNPEDVELALHAFKRALFANRVYVVQNGEEALDYLFCRGKYVGRHAAKRLPVVLLDLTLPKMSGLEVLRQIRANGRTAVTPVVILTGSKNSHDLNECERLGANAYLFKPVTFQRLSQMTPQLKLNWVLLEPTEIKVQPLRM